MINKHVVLIVDSLAEFECDSKVLFSSVKLKSHRVPSCLAAIETVAKYSFSLIIFLLRQGMHEECYSKFYQLRQNVNCLLLAGVYGSEEFTDQMHMDLMSSGADIVFVNPPNIQMARQTLTIMQRICERSSCGYWADEDVIAAQHMKIIVPFRKVLVKDVEVALPPKAFDILVLLARRPWEVLTYKEIYEGVWNEPFKYVSHEAIWTHIHTLRFLLKVADDVPEYIRNFKGRGYTFEPYPKDPYLKS